MNKELFYSKLKSSIELKLPFVLFRKPDENGIWLAVENGGNNFRFLLHSFDSKKEKFISDEMPIEMPLDDFDFNSELLLSFANDFIPTTKDKYESQINDTIKATEDKGIPKIVFSRIRVEDNKGIDLFRSFKNLAEQNKNCLVYLWYNPGEETWMGATPELLLKQEGSRIDTVALAGTKVPEAEWTQKEYDEQQFVTDFILENISGLINVETRGPETIKAGKLNHLKTYISAEAGPEFDRAALLEKIHPTPAVCGFPKKGSFDYIIENEGYDRDFYTGYIGLETAELKTYFVNLRCARFFRDKVWLYVGGGITADSHPEREWEETQLKSGTVLNALTN